MRNPIPAFLARGALVLLALLASVTLWAQSTFTVSDGWFSRQDLIKFRVSRTNTTTVEQVRYRTEGLSAYPGQHFRENVGTLTFEYGVQYIDVEVLVNESRHAFTYNMGRAYLYQLPDTPRSFRFEVRDMTEHNILDSKVYSFQYGKQYSVDTRKLNREVVDLVRLNSSGNAFESGTSKYFDFYMNLENPNSLTVTDHAIYEQAALFSLQHYTNRVVGDPDYDGEYIDRTYLEQQMGGKMYATACFTQSEEDDGYQYIQIVVTDSPTANVSSVSDFTNDPDKGVNDPDKSIYKACFELSGGTSAVTSDYKQYFPRRYGAGRRDQEAAYFDEIYNHTGVRPNSEFSHPDGILWKQKFKDNTYKADKSGAVVFPPTNQQLFVLFDADGNNEDTWYVKNLFVRFAIGDVRPPALIDNIRVTVGYYYRGTPTNLCVPFNEIVKVTGTPTLSTSWGTFTYEAGNGTNVLSFHGTIDAAPGTRLAVTGLSGTVTDLAGNPFVLPTSGLNVDNVSVVGTNDINDVFTVDDEGNGVIATQEDLKKLAQYVSDGNDIVGKKFVQTADITLTDTYITTRIGNAEHPFQGTYDGGGHSVSGLFNIAGLFGVINENSTVKGVVLQSSTITGSGEGGTGGIVGKNDGGTVEDCYVMETVTVRAGSAGARYLGGIVGYNAGSTAVVEGCRSKASVIDNGKTGCQSFGGVVGYNSGTVKYCFYQGSSVTAGSQAGALVGEDAGGTLNNNFYTPGGLPGGLGGSDITSKNGAQFAYIITLGQYIGLESQKDAYSTSTIIPYSDGIMTCGGTCYGCAATTIWLTYSNTTAPPKGYEAVMVYTGADNVEHSVTKNYSRYYFRMPSENVSVTTSVAPISYAIKYDESSYITLSSNANPGSYTVEDADITLVAPTREGWVFEGWYTDKNYENLAQSPQIPHGSTGTKRFYSKWTASETITITIPDEARGLLFGEQKYVTTFYNYTLSYQLSAGALAYTVTKEGSDMVFHRIGEDSDIIPSNKAVVIVSDQKEITLTRFQGTKPTTYGNDLNGYAEPKTVSEDGWLDNKRVYVLGVVNGVVGFYRFPSGTLPAGKACFFRTQWDAGP